MREPVIRTWRVEAGCSWPTESQSMAPETGCAWSGRDPVRGSVWLCQREEGGEEEQGFLSYPAGLQPGPAGLQPLQFGEYCRCPSSWASPCPTLGRQALCGKWVTGSNPSLVSNSRRLHDLFQPAFPHPKVEGWASRFPALLKLKFKCSFKSPP